MHRSGQILSQKAAGMEPGVEQALPYGCLPELVERFDATLAAPGQFVVPRARGAHVCSVPALIVRHENQWMHLYVLPESCDPLQDPCFQSRLGEGLGVHSIFSPAKPRVNPARLRDYLRGDVPDGHPGPFPEPLNLRDDPGPRVARVRHIVFIFEGKATFGKHVIIDRLHITN